MNEAIASQQPAAENVPLKMEHDLRALYLDMVERCVIGTVYEDPNFDHWSPHQYDPALRELGRDWPSKAHSMIGRVRMRNLRAILEHVIERGIPGDFVETGVWRGGACILARAVFRAYGARDRKVWVADSFAGLPPPDPKYAADAGDPHHVYKELAVSLEEVKSNFDKYGLLDDQVVFLQGWFADTLATAGIQKLAVCRLDGDMYGSTMDALVALYDKVVPGGFIIVDDWVLRGCQQAVRDFRGSRGIQDPIHDIDGFGAFWQKLGLA